MSYTVNSLGRVLKNGQVVSPKNMKVLNTNYQIKTFKNVKPILIGGKLFGVTNNGSVVYRNNYGRIVFKMRNNGTKAKFNGFNTTNRKTRNFNKEITKALEPLTTYEKRTNEIYVGRREKAIRNAEKIALESGNLNMLQIVQNARSSNERVNLQIQIKNLIQERKNNGNNNKNKEMRYRNLVKKFKNVGGAISPSMRWPRA
jgi:hypothetical protein